MDIMMIITDRRANRDYANPLCKMACNLIIIGIRCFDRYHLEGADGQIFRVSL